MTSSLADQAIDLWWADKIRRSNQRPRKNIKNIVKIMEAKLLFWMTLDSENSTVPTRENEEEDVDWLKEWDTLIDA